MGGASCRLAEEKQVIRQAQQVLSSVVSSLRMLSQASLSLALKMWKDTKPVSLPTWHALTSCWSAHSSRGKVTGRTKQIFSCSRQQRTCNSLISDSLEADWLSIRTMGFESTTKYYQSACNQILQNLQNLQKLTVHPEHCCETEWAMLLLTTADANVCNGNTHNNNNCYTMIIMIQ